MGMYRHGIRWWGLAAIAATACLAGAGAAQALTPAPLAAPAAVSHPVELAQFYGWERGDDWDRRREWRRWQREREMRQWERRRNFGGWRRDDGGQRDRGYNGGYRGYNGGNRGYNRSNGPQDRIIEGPAPGSHFH